MVAAPPRHPPDSLSLLLSSSSAASAVYASGSLIRPPPPPLSCPPRRRDQQQTRNGGRMAKGKGDGGGRGRGPQRAGDAAGRSRAVRSSRCSRRCVLACLLLGSLATLVIPVALYLISVLLSAGDDHARPAPAPPPPSTGSLRPSASSSDYRLLLLHHGSSSSPPPLPSSSSSAPPPPPDLPLDLPFRFLLPPHHLLYSRLSLPLNSLLLLNLTLSPNARLVLFARHSLRPTPGEHDWQRIVAADRLHGGTRRDRSGTGVLRQTLISHYMTAGPWYLGFLNDREQADQVTLLATVAEGTVDGSLSADGDAHPLACQFDCFGKGSCRGGRCVCHPGYGGMFCEETACPVLCSGNGMFSGGRCQCHVGFKGAECEFLANWCADPTCGGGNGECTAEGKCRCGEGWTGDSCGERRCRKDCSGRGICREGRCYCELGWTGEGCERRAKDEEEEKQNERKKWREEKKKGRMEEKEEDGEGKEEEREEEEEECPFGCTEHGQCSPGAQCRCEPGWTGRNCQIESCPRNCSLGGQCSLSSEGWHCQCDSAHFGDHCQFGREQNCEDGQDDDGDGLTDCEDSAECCAHPSCSSNPLCLGVFLSRDSLLLRPASARPSASFFDRVRFLFDGSDLSVQRYADIVLFDPKRVSVLRGRIFANRGGPLTGVRVSDAHNPHHGFSLSRAEVPGDDGETAGAFELALNGGAMVTVQFVRQPFGRLMRSFYLPPNRILNIGTVWMDLQPPPPSSPPSTSSVASCIDAVSRLRFRPSVLRPSRRSSLLGSSRLSLDSATVSLAIPLPGHFAHHSLVFSSSGTRSVLRIQLLGDELPEGLLRVQLIVEVAGKREERLMAPERRLRHEFVWDRENALWQREFGMVRGQVSVGLHLAQCAVPLWHFVPFLLDAHPLPGLLPRPFWSLSSVHRLHPAQGLLHRGDGEIWNLGEEGPMVVKKLVGGGRRECGGGGGKAEGKGCVGQREPAEASSLRKPGALAEAQGGAVYVGDAELVRRLSADGQFLDTLLQLDASDSSHPYFFAVHPFTSQLHISLPLRRQIWKLVDVGHHDLVVLPDDALSFPKGITFDARGNLLVADGRSLKRIVPKGEGGGESRVETLVAQNRAWRPLRDCARMAALGELILEWPSALSWDPISGHLFLLDSASVIFRIDLLLGIVAIVVGSQTGCERRIEAPIEAIVFSVDEGVLYWTETDGNRTNLVKSLRGARNYLLGTAKTLDANTLASQSLKALATLTSSGDLLVADQGNAELKRVQRVGIDFDTERRVYRVDRADTGEQFEFDEEGRHMMTRRLAGGILLRNITYEKWGEEEERVMLSRVEEGERGGGLRVRKEAEGWNIEGGGGPDEEALLLRVTEEKKPGRSETEISSPSLAQPIKLQFRGDGLLEAVFSGTEGTFMSYNEESGRPMLAKFPDGRELKAEDAEPEGRDEG